MRDFSFNGVSLSSLGGRIIESPMHTIATRDKSFIKVYGQSGDEVVDNGSYNNVNFSVKIGFFTFVSHQTAEQLARAIINWLAPLQDGYYVYRDSYNTGYFTKAALTNFNEIVREMRTFLTATLKFSRVPFWYKDSGTSGITFSDQGIIENPEIYPSKPVLNLTYTGSDASIDVRIEFNGTPVIVNMGALQNVQFLDGVEKQHYMIKNGNKVYLSSALPPNLPPGDTLITFNTSSVSCTLTPNWRRL